MTFAEIISASNSNSGVACGIYTTNSADACEYILKDSGARIAVVEDEIQLEKFLKCKATCQIDAIIQYTGEVKNSYMGLVQSVCFFTFLIFI
jgi:long-subunit acyl-CoA synthetase (AMP-forming)